jgi:N-acetylglucosaminyl-diphospho-decaprenol L-rhamnosyltransferase
VSTKAHAKVSAVILDFNKAGRVVENVKGLLRQQTDFAIEIIVADNSCNPANAAILAPLAELPGVRLFINAENTGYVRGCNQAARHATGDYILIVNPDILWPDAGAVQQLVDYLDSNPQVGIVGPRQIDDSTGCVSATARAFPRLHVQILRRSPLRNFPWLRKLVDYDEMAHLDMGRTQPVDWLQSSCLLIRRTLWEDLGGFDGRYVMFLADPEICWQTWARNLAVVYYAGASVSADGIRCSSGGFRDFFRSWVLRQHLRDSIRYRLRHAWRKNPRSLVSSDQSHRICHSDMPTIG